MFKRKILIVALTTVLVPGVAGAGGSSGRTTFGRANYNPAPVVVPVYVPTPVPTTYDSAFFDNVETARLRVYLPRDAKLWIEDELTRQTGLDRRFESPELTPGRDYVFHLRAEWMENGKKVTRVKNVPIHAGDLVNIDFVNGK